MHSRGIVVHAVHHQGPAPTDVVDRVVRDLLIARRLHDYVEPIRVLFLQLRPLRVCIDTVELDVLVRGAERARDLRLEPTLLPGTIAPDRTVDVNEPLDDAVHYDSTEDEEDIE